jgi:hypothetical protein
MDYPLMETPFALVPFSDMNKKQAEQYFHWFMQEKNKRLDQLEGYINKTNTVKVILDKSPESLIPLWEWFEYHNEWEEKAEDELRAELIGRPEWMQRHIIAETKTFTTLTLAIIMDISIYFSETLIQNNPTIYWGFKSSPKKLDGVNRPILLGFKGDINVFPFTLVKVCARKSTRSKNKNQLYNLYNTWCKNV